MQNLYPQTYETDMARMIDWASSVELGHLLSHTSGLVHSSDKAAAAQHFGVVGEDGLTHPVDEDDLTYPQVHLMALLGMTVSREDSDDLKCYLNGSLYVRSDNPAYTGKTYQLPPLLAEPGTDRCYSNHAFALAGHVIDEWAGPDEESATEGVKNTYHDVIRRSILAPLGLTGVVANNADTISDLDAEPYGSELDPETVSRLLTAAGGWSASAQDMARIMCGLDQTSNHLRLLQPETVTTMESIAYPAASATQPLGWDRRTNGVLVKNGSVPGEGRIPPSTCPDTLTRLRRTRSTSPSTSTRRSRRRTT